MTHLTACLTRLYKLAYLNEKWPAKINGLVGITLRYGCRIYNWANLAIEVNDLNFIHTIKTQ